MSYPPPIYQSPLHTYTPSTDCDDSQIQRDPKWTQAIISLFSSNAMEILIELLKKLSEVVLPSWCQRQPLTVTHAGSIVNLATYALQLLKAMLTSLLSDGNYQLRDARVVSALLAIHTVLCSAPYSSVISSAAPEVKAQYCVSTFLKKLILLFYVYLYVDSESDY